jgi:hypothetical protein
VRQQMPKLDILEELNKVLGNRPGTANSDSNVLAQNIPVPYYVLSDARAEIDRLRRRISETILWAKEIAARNKVDGGLE